jgi:hypothetical protein
MEPINHCKRQTDMIGAECYRNYESNYVFAQNEQEVLYKDDGVTYRAPDEIKRER